MSDAIDKRDYVRPFLFESLDIRGVFVQLTGAWQKMTEGRGYAPQAMRLLGEMTAVTVLIAANLKQPGRMTFQLKGNGPVERLVIDCDEQLRLRGMAHAEPTIAEAAVPDLLGHGQLALTLDMARYATPYQSLVPLDGDTIAAIFEHYLTQSEQQPARLFLVASENAAAGLFLQKLPGADSCDADGWNRIQVLAETLGPAELLSLPSVKLLTRLFPEEDIRIFDPRTITYHCPEDREKIRNMLKSLGRSECEAILKEHGAIVVHDDICNREYRFEAEEIAELLPPEP